MKSLLILSVLTIAAFLLLPAMVFAQTNNQAGAGPPLGQPLVREGTLAVKLAGVFQLGQTTSEVDAESLLSTAGIAPRNGWIADYPVTPDIAGELRSAVAAAASGGSLTMGEDEALAAYDAVMTQYDLSVRAGTSGEATGEQSAPDYPDTAVINNYYYDYGPPVVTYYAPPVDYAYLYTWVPYPFQWWDVWFPGFFVLVDFDVPVFVNGEACFVTNHFFDRDDDTFVRINAFDRFHSTTFADRTAVVGPSYVPTTARTTFRHFWAGGGHRGFRTMGSGMIVPRRESGVGRRSFAHERRGRFAPNRESHVGQWNGAYGAVAPHEKSYNATRRISPPVGAGRPFEGYRGESFGGTRSFATHERSYSAPAPGRFSPPLSTAGPRSRSFGRTRTFAPPARSYSAPAPREFGHFSTGRSFEGFRGGGHGGMRGR